MIHGPGPKPFFLGGIGESICREEQDELLSFSLSFLLSSRARAEGLGMSNVRPVCGSKRRTENADRHFPV